MKKERPHIVRKLTLDVDIRASRDSLNLQDELSEMFRKKIASLLEEVFDRYSIPGEVIRIDRIELDLGDIRAERLADFEAKFLEAIRAKLKSVLSRRKAPPGTVSGRKKFQEPALRLDMLRWFLEKGYLPWWGSTSEGRPEEWIASLSPEELEKLIRQAIRRPLPLKRLVRQFSAESLEALLTILIQEKSKDFVRILEEEVAIAAKEWGIAPTAIQSLAWEVALETAGKTTEKQAAPGPKQFRSILKARLISLKNTKARAGKEQLGQSKERAGDIRVPADRESGAPRLEGLQSGREGGKQRVLDAIAFFLIHGRLPEGSPFDSAYSLEKALIEISTQSPSELISLLREIGTNRFVAERLVYQFPSPAFEAIMELLAPEQGPDLMGLTHIMAEQLSGIPAFEGWSITALRNRLSIIGFQYFASAGSGSPAQAEWLPAILESLAYSYALSPLQMVEILLSPSPAGETRLPEKWSRRLTALRERYRSDERKTGREQPKDGGKNIRENLIPEEEKEAPQTLVPEFPFKEAQTPKEEESILTELEGVADEGPEREEEAPFEEETSDTPEKLTPILAETGSPTLPDEVVSLSGEDVPERKLKPVDQEKELKEKQLVPADPEKELEMPETDTEDISISDQPAEKTLQLSEAIGPASVVDVLVGFLHSGRIAERPPATGGPSISPEQLLADAIRLQPAALRKALFDLLPVPSLIKRLVFQLPEDARIDLVDLLHPGLAGIMHTHLLALEKAGQESPELKETYFSPVILWHITFYYLLHPKTREAAGELDLSAFFQFTLQTLAARSDRPYATLVKILQATIQPYGRDFQSRFYPLQEMMAVLDSSPETESLPQIIVPEELLGLSGEVQESVPETVDMEASKEAGPKSKEEKTAQEGQEETKERKEKGQQERETKEERKKREVEEEAEKIREVEKELEESAEQEISRHEPPPVTYSGQKLLTFLLTYGSFPEGHQAVQAFSGKIGAGRFLESLLQQEKTETIDTLRVLMENPMIRRRIVQLFPETVVNRIVELFLEKQAAETEAFRKDLEIILEKTEGVMEDVSLLRSVSSDRFLAEVRKGAGFEPTTFITTVIQTLASGLDIPFGELLIRIRKQTESLLPELKSPIRVTLGKIAKSGRREQRLKPKPETEQRAEARKRKSPPETPDLMEDAAFVDNAGLVILHPFLSRYFQLLGLREGNAFRDEASASRAVHLLQYLAFKRTETPEHLLLLNKVLCGIPVETPVELGITMTEQEIAISEQMLRATVENWGTIKRTSNDGLRETFLQRAGKLQETEDFWILQVEPAPFDMLLDTLPWTLSMIKLPWMGKILQVTWR